MLSRCVTSSFSSLLNKNPSRPLKKFKWRDFYSKSSCWKAKKEDDGPKIITPGNCAVLPRPILEPSCKNAIIIGGTDGFGFAAADHLLCRGAKNVIIADDDPVEGRKAVQKLCNSHGKRRVHYMEYDIRNHCQAETGLKAAICKVNTVHIIFNDLDKKRPPPKYEQPKDDKDGSRYSTFKTIRAGAKILGKDHGGVGGIIINCASIFGFMGWPADPYPIYCKKEPVIEITRDLAEEYNEKKTGVRLVALCPTTKQFSEIGLPDIPPAVSSKNGRNLPLCIPAEKHHIGTPLIYVMAWAKTGSAWLMEPAISVRQIPRLIHFPEKEVDKVDPKIYEEQTCTVKLDPPCVDTSKACKVRKKHTCITKPPKEEKCPVE